MKHILFITGTRADYGKLKSLMLMIENHEHFSCTIYVTGMHLLEAYGSTYHEIEKDGYKDIFLAWEDMDSKDVSSHSMSENLGKVVLGLTKYLKAHPVDLIVVHGDRTDALAGAITGALNNIRVAHIEGGEVSGTIDDSIRHAITKFASYHLVANDEAKRRVIQLGEPEDSIIVLGSPDIDVMLSEGLPSLEETKEHYDILFPTYSIVLFHPVTTELSKLARETRALVSALKESRENYIVVYPNNDLGSEMILEAYSELKEPRFKLFPSLRFEYFLTLLKNANFIIGNSSAGVREAGIYDVKAIDIGSRQSGRYNPELHNVVHVEAQEELILEAIQSPYYKGQGEALHFGFGNSYLLFKELIEQEEFWCRKIQKSFVDLED